MWEAENTNTPERGPRETKKYGIKVPVGYDGHVDGARVSVTMHRFGTGGTPWTIVIDKSGKVRFNEVSPSSTTKLDELIAKLQKQKTKPKRKSIKKPNK